MEATDVTESSIIVHWTQRPDVEGDPSDYRVKYRHNAGDWGAATTACDVEGTEIGADASCAVTGLSPGLVYTIQLMSYRLEDGAWVDPQYSNEVRVTTASGS